MKFKDFKDANCTNYDFFTAEELSYKEFIRLSFGEFARKNPNSSWMLSIDDRSFDSFPNFTQKHPICLSDLNFKDSVFQFRICSENSVQSLGHRIFTCLDGIHKDFVASEIKQTDEVMMKLKTGVLKDFTCVSKCGWWITDIWRDMYPVTDESESENFVADMLGSEFSAQMRLINERLLSAQNSGELDRLIAELRMQE